jgi:hypothetical protein
MNEMEEFENRLLPFEIFIFNRLDQNEQCRLKAAVLILVLIV